MNSRWLVHKASVTRLVITTAYLSSQTLYKLETGITNEDIESKQLDYMNQLENFYDAIINKNSDSQMMPSQKLFQSKSL